MSAPTTAGAPPVVDLRGRTPWSVLPALLLGFFMIMVDTTIVNIAVPTLVETFDVGLSAVAWVTSAYLLTYAVLLLVTGRLGDRYGPKNVFVVGLAVFTLSSLWCGLSGSIAMLVVARAVQGVGAALMTPQTMAIITRVFPPHQRGAAMGLWGSVAGIATITGPVLGGLFVESLGWEWIFFVNIPVGLIALFFAVRTLPALARSTKSFDVVGVVLSVVGLAALVFGVQEGETFDWGQVWGPITIPLIIGFGVVVIAAFLVWQHRLGADALLPLSLFHHRNFSLANVSGMAVSFAMIGIFFPLTIFLQSTLGLSPLHAALIGLPGSLVSGVVAPFAGRLSDRIPAKWVMVTGFASLAVATVWLDAVIAPGVSPWTIVAPMVLFGVGTGCVFSPMASLATAGLDHTTAGAGAGAFNTTRQVGGVIGSAAVVAMLQARLAVTLPDAAREAATALPAEFRAAFVDGFAAAGGSFTGGSAAVAAPDGVPADVAASFAAAAQDAFNAGFATAAGQTMLLVAAVLVVGLVAGVAMRRESGHVAG